jgi:hypothetical protein
MISIRCTHQFDTWQPTGQHCSGNSAWDPARTSQPSLLVFATSFCSILGTASTLAQTASPAQCAALLVAVGLPAVATPLAGKRLSTRAEDLASLVAVLPAESPAELAAELAVQLAPAPASAQLRAWRYATHDSGLDGACAAARKAPKFVSFRPTGAVTYESGMLHFAQAAAKHYNICIVHRADKPNVLFRGRQT